MSEGSAKSKAEQLKVIKRGRGAKYILDEAYKILGNPMLIHDMEYVLVAASRYAADDDPIWNEFMRNGRLGNEIIEFVKTEGFIDDVANSTMYDGITYLTSDNLKYNRIFGQLYNKDRVPVADLVAVECESPFPQDMPELVKILCDILSKELSKSAYYLDYGHAYREKIVKELIDDVIVDANTYAGHVANIDATLKKHVFAAVADISHSDAKHNSVAHFRDLFKRTQPAFEYCVYNDHIVMLLSWDDWELSEKRGLDKLRRLFERQNIYAGVSSRFDNLFELQRRYAEAVAALRCGLIARASQRFFWHGEMGMDI